MGATASLLRNAYGPTCMAVDGLLGAKGRVL
jgi:hypothetical protein